MENLNLIYPDPALYTSFKVLGARFVEGYVCGKYTRLLCYETTIGNISGRHFRDFRNPVGHTFRPSSYSTKHGVKRVNLVIIS